jgi:hypothetical protein
MKSFVSNEHSKKSYPNLTRNTQKTGNFISASKALSLIGMSIRALSNPNILEI